MKIYSRLLMILLCFVPPLHGMYEAILNQLNKGSTVQTFDNLNKLSGDLVVQYFMCFGKIDKDITGTSLGFLQLLLAWIMVEKGVASAFSAEITMAIMDFKKQVTSGKTIMSEKQAISNVEMLDRQYKVINSVQLVKYFTAKLLQWLTNAGYAYDIASSIDVLIRQVAVMIDIHNQIFTEAERYEVQKKVDIVDAFKSIASLRAQESIDRLYLLSFQQTFDDNNKKEIEKCLLTLVIAEDANNFIQYFPIFRDKLGGYDNIIKVSRNF